MTDTTRLGAGSATPGRGSLRAAVRTPEGVGLLVLLAFTLTALAGYAIFGLRPENLPDSGPIMAFWPVSFRFFAQLHILLGAGVLLIALVRYARTRWIAAFAAVYLVSFLSEYLGTGYGIPFGNYEYTALLGSKLGGRVPWMIPLSWFLMAAPAWALARLTFPETAPEVEGVVRRTAARVAFAAVILTLWDLALDPAMSYQSPYYWRWSDAGPYYGMPWINLAGWLLTGTVIFAAFEWLKVGRWLDAIPIRWLAGYYAVTLLMPVGVIVLEGLWIAVIATSLSYLAAWIFHLRIARGRSREVGGTGVGYGAGAGVGAEVGVEVGVQVGAGVGAGGKA